jgi:hypothetical protein
LVFYNDGKQLNLISQITKNMQTDSFVIRHIGPDEDQIKEMLKTIGVKSLDELIYKTIPDDIRLHESLKLPEPMSENEFSFHINVSNFSNDYSLRSFGAYFSSSPISRNDFKPFDNITPQVSYSGNSFITDSC